MFFDVEKNRLYLPADSILYFGSSYDANSDPAQNYKVLLEKGFLKFKRGQEKTGVVFNIVNEEDEFISETKHWQLNFLSRTQINKDKHLQTQLSCVWGSSTEAHVEVAPKGITKKLYQEDKALAARLRNEHSELFPNLSGSTLSL